MKLPLTDFWREFPEMLVQVINKLAILGFTVGKAWPRKTWLTHHLECSASHVGIYEFALFGARDLIQILMITFRNTFDEL